MLRYAQYPAQLNITRWNGYKFTPVHIRRKIATAKDLTSMNVMKIYQYTRTQTNRKSWNQDKTYRTAAKLVSESFDTVTTWRERGMENDPDKRNRINAIDHNRLSFNLRRKTRMQLNRFWTGHGRSGHREMRLQNGSHF